MITHTYPEAAKEYNVAQIGKFTQVRGEYQACRVAFFHGFGSGVY